MVNCKSASIDRITGEMIQNEGEALIGYIGQRKSGIER